MLIYKEKHTISVWNVVMIILILYQVSYQFPTPEKHEIMTWLAAANLKNTALLRQQA